MSIMEVTYMVHNKQFYMETQNPYCVNREYKDCLLRIAFREKEDLLELYNAINGSDYKDPKELVVYTLEDVVFLGIKNDISFLIGEMLNLYEHQSTKNPNMPIRGLLYFARNYASYIARNDLDIYSSTLQKLPFPQYYILYNGREEEADRCIIELEDAFPEMDGLEPCLKCTATLLNINCGHNRKIMEHCKTLNDYAIFVQRLRDNQDLGMELGAAVEKAVDDCINEGILKNILIKNRAEVKDMVLGAWGTELHLRKVREERERMEQQKEEIEHQKEEIEHQREEMEHQREEIERQKEQVEKLEQRTAAVNLLTQKLLQAGMLGALEKASRDEAYQTKLLEDYGLLNK